MNIRWPPQSSSCIVKNYYQMSLYMHGSENLELSIIRQCKLFCLYQPIIIMFVSALGSDTCTPMRLGKRCLQRLLMIASDLWREYL